MSWKWVMYIHSLYPCKAISYTVGFVSRKRPFSTKAQIGLSYTVEKGLFRLNFFRLRIPTGGSSRKTRLDPPVEKLKSKTFYTCFLNRSHRSSHHQTHTHTATRPHTHPRYHTAVSHKALTVAWLSLLLLLAASKLGAFLFRSPAACITRRQQRAVSIPCCQQRLRLL